MSKEPKWTVTYEGDCEGKIASFLASYNLEHVSGVRKDDYNEIQAEDAAKLFNTPTQGVFLSVSNKLGWVVNVAFQPFANAFYVYITHTPFDQFGYSQANMITDKERQGGFSTDFLVQMGKMIENLNASVKDVRSP